MGLELESQEPTRTSDIVALCTDLSGMAKFLRFGPLRVPGLSRSV